MDESKHIQTPLSSVHNILFQWYFTFKAKFIGKVLPCTKLLSPNLTLYLLSISFVNQNADSSRCSLASNQLDQIYLNTLSYGLISSQTSSKTLQRTLTLTWLVILTILGCLNLLFIGELPCMLASQKATYNCSIFTGSGISASCKYDNWTHLVMISCK